MPVRFPVAPRGARILRRSALLATAAAMIAGGPAIARTPAAALAVAAQDPPVAPEAGQVISGPTKSAGTSSETVNMPGGKPQVPTDPLSGVPVVEDTEGSGDVVVTGSRIVRDGYSAPTPVSVVSAEELKAEAPANITDFVNTLPAVRGSGTSATSNGSLSNGAAGINSVNLRALGAARTLVLFDGQRSVASTTTGQVDVNTFPQALIERVEVVTGGASSAYGSDAVSGVVNFILDRDFTGMKLEYEFGVTTYDDGPNHKIAATAGQSFADGKGHILLSGEYFSQKGIQSIDRDWNETGFFTANNPAYSATGNCARPAGYVAGTPIAGCAPEYFTGSGIGTGQFTPGGLISTGPFRGTYFGTVNPATGKASVNQLTFGATSGQWMIGGDIGITTAGHRGSATLLPDEKRASGFGRLSYEFAPWFELFGQFSHSYYRGKSFYQQTPTTGVTIQVAPTAANGGLINAYLPADFVTRVNTYNADPTTADITSVAIGTSNINIPPQGSDNERQVRRYVVGANGDFGMLGKDWRWDAYYQLGKTDTREMLTNAWNLSRMAMATDAVVAPAGNAAGIAAGTIVCRSTLTSRNNGCIPLNRIGVGGATPQAIAYVLGDGAQPLRTQNLKQQVAAINLSTNNLVDLWAGPISIAFGGEVREESVKGFVDPQYQPIVTSTATGPVTTGTWIYGNYLPAFGKYNVKEAYVEAVIPLFRGADFNGAARVTDYSTSGSVRTWKAGATWQVIPDVKLRGTVSRDIRAPNLAELFAPGTGRTNTVNVPIAGGAVRPDQFNESTVGNAGLTPEVAKTYGGGAVFTPTFLPGFAASVDYYNIKISDAIDVLAAQVLVDQCYQQAIANSCGFISTTGGRGVVTPGLVVTSIEIKPFNFVSTKTSGIDFEASYRRAIGPGNLTLRALASYAIELKTDNGATLATDAAGQNTGGLPDWTYRLTAGYDLPMGLGFQFIGRGVSNGVYNNNFIVCTADCPASTADRRTVNTNSVAGAFYLDFNANYDFAIDNAKAQVFLSIRNVANTDPVLVGSPAGIGANNTPAYPQTNRALYDVLGRVFRMGFRIGI